VFNLGMLKSFNCPHFSFRILPYALRNSAFYQQPAATDIC